MFSLVKFFPGAQCKYTDSYYRKNWETSSLVGKQEPNTWLLYYSGIHGARTANLAGAKKEQLRLTRVVWLSVPGLCQASVIDLMHA